MRNLGLRALRTRNPKFRYPLHDPGRVTERFLSIIKKVRTAHEFSERTYGVSVGQRVSVGRRVRVGEPVGEGQRVSVGRGSVGARVGQHVSVGRVVGLR